MAGTHLTLTTTGLDGLQARIQVIAGLDTSTLMPRLGEALLTSQQRFSTQTDPDGNAWQALMPRTRKRKKHNKTRILTEYGGLHKNLYYQVLTPRSVKIQSNLVYAATHQYGRSGIPARPFLGLSTSDHQTIARTIRAWADDLGFK